MRYRTIGTDPAARREVSVLSLGAMLMGSRTDEETSFAILDRYVEAGGTFIDTSGNYAFWVNGTQGGESEELLGRWRSSRGIGDEIVIATKAGARPLAPSTGFVDDFGQPVPMEGLSAKVLRESALRSMSRPSVPRLDLMYAHIEDPAVPLLETVEGFASLVTSGLVGLLGVSNHWAWRVERARSLAFGAGLPGYEVLQYHHTYLRQRADCPADAEVAGWLGGSGERGPAELSAFVAWARAGRLLAAAERGLRPAGPAAGRRVLACGDGGATGRAPRCGG